MKKILVLVGFVIFSAVACTTFMTRHPASDPITMDIEQLKAKAFLRCQNTYHAPVIQPVPVLDPPIDGHPDWVGMVYQEELAVRTTNLLDRDGFYFSPRPRAAVNSLPMDIYVDNDRNGNYRLKTWDDANVDYSSSTIQPPIIKNDIPAAGRVLTELIIGHVSPKGDYPQLFDLRSSAYVRFAGYPPQITGASLRLGAHKIFGLSGKDDPNPKEDFPIIRELYATVKDNNTAGAYLLVESDLFCGALSLDMVAGTNADLIVDGYWYTRRDFTWAQDPNTALVVYSSMLWKTEKNTDRISGEAHDSDMLTVNFGEGPYARYPLNPPPTGLRVRDLTQATGQQPTGWILANEDQDPSHYADYLPALQNTNYNFRASYSVSILESNVKTSVSLYEQSTTGEYGDNIVAASTLRQDIRKSVSVDQPIHFKYKTTSFFPSAQ